MGAGARCSATCDQMSTPVNQGWWESLLDGIDQEKSGKGELQGKEWSVVMGL